MALEFGKAFPEFSLLNQDGQMVTLGDFVGKWLVVYVYPKTTRPAARFRENHLPRLSRNLTMRTSRLVPPLDYIPLIF